MDPRRLRVTRRPAVARRPFAFLIVALLCIVAAAPASAVFAQSTTAGPVPAGLWKLTTASTFVEGCFAPCMCPVLYNDPLLGTVRLTSAAPEAGFAVYTVSDLHWLVKGFEYWVTGTGTYRIGGQPLMHRLTLDLKVGDRDVAHFDSGLVAVSTSDGSIAITISMNNMVCRDTVFNVTMRPLFAQEIAPYGLRQSLYEEGCFGPCDCAVRTWPFIGRFGLVRLDGNTTSAAWTTPGDFGIVDLRGTVLDPAAPANTGSPVAGGGLYHVDAATTTQRLRVALLENGAGPTRFDSGDVAWGGDLKRIDADVAANGFACTDRVYSIHARRKPRSDLANQAIRPDPAHPGVTPAP